MTTMNNEAEKTDNKHSKFQWFLVTVFIPTIFTVVVATIVLTTTDINIFTKAKEVGEKIPYISTLMEEPKSSQSENVNQQKEKMADLEVKIADQQSEIEEMEGLLDEKDATIQRNDLEKQQLETEINQLRQQQDTVKREYTDIIKTYETMSPKKSAPIITAMNDEDAVGILANMKTDTLASVIEQMPPSDAARLMKQLTDKVDIQQR